jgi:VIT1/CCC1 family predicted Fe2+/Mn2+ transporter
VTVEPPFVEPIEAHVADATADARELQDKIDTVARGAARAAVLGVNDGLVTNVCLILAVVGADGSASAIRVAGLASLIAGAFSMAAGEWISVRSQVDLYRGILAELRSLVRRNPGLVLQKLTDRMVEAGFATDTARRAATELPLQERSFLDFSARTVFGLNPDELGSPITVATSSFVLFAVGATIPLAPWFLVEGGAAIATSVVLTAVASALVGAWVGRSSGASASRAAGRQLLIVVAAAGVTYGIGSLFGTSVA